ncbi:trehalose-6-phosphate synthase [Candidatus Woesearchaeota archaeon]|nr:trehalose-6-phosphate synthase [Candidatus Woesearchaeota archaeon]
MAKLVIAGNRSPIDYSKGKESNVAIGGVTQALVGCLTDDDVYVCISQGDDDPNRVDAVGEIPVSAGDYRFRMKKVFLDAQDYRRYYEGTANSFLWPLFHLNSAAYYEISPTFPRPRFDGNDFFTYSKVNGLVADAVLEAAGEDGVVWVQDYHLLLTPARVKEAKSKLRVGQFIHIPMFHPAIVDRYLSESGEAQECLHYLFDALLANDLLGFHIQDYVENFGAAFSKFFPSVHPEPTNEGLIIQLNEKRCHVEHFPIGVDVAGISQQAQEPLQVTLADGRRLEDIIKDDKERGRKLFVGVERSDYTKGLLERLFIIDKLLEAGMPVRYIGAMAISREQIDAYRELIAQVESTRNQLNQKWQPRCGYEPIIIDTQGLKPPQNYALLREADCVLMPLYEDGMNLVFQESILAKQFLPHDRRGFIAVGNCGAEKMAFRYGDQHGVVRIDPFDVSRSVDKICRTFQSQYNISDALIQHALQRDVNQWRDNFLKRLREIEIFPSKP